MSNVAFVVGESELCFVDGADQAAFKGRLDAFVGPDHLGRKAVRNTRKNPLESLKHYNMKRE